MENEEFFEGIEAGARLRSRQSQRDHHTVTAASGGLDILPIRENECSPLLAEQEENFDHSSDSPDGDERREDFKWQGETDFEGVSWWNKPSVSRTSQLSCCPTLI